jgi:hypothetical protein
MSAGDIHFDHTERLGAVQANGRQCERHPAANRALATDGPRLERRVALTGAVPTHRQAPGYWDMVPCAACGQEGVSI